MPRVSVIIPVFNAETYLRECLDSLLSQSLRDFEVLCVDDGSTDGSMEILMEYSESDSRLAVIEQRNAGAGVARNTGMAAANGEYLSFLDADDFFEPTMLEDAYRQCVADAADVGLYRARYYDTATGQYTSAEGLLRFDMLPDRMPFSRADMPDEILYFSSPAPWNKMFRRGFVVDAGLQFQDLKRANDFYFTRLALVRAERITVIDKVLINYRVGADSNLQATNHETPLEFYKSLVALRDELVRIGLYDDVERSFTNAALSNSLYNLNSLRTPEAFAALYAKLRDEYFLELGITGREEDFFKLRRQYNQYVQLMSGGPEEYLIDEVAYLRRRITSAHRRLAKTRARLSKTESQIERVRRSRSYRVSQSIHSIAQRASALVSRERKAE